MSKLIRFLSSGLSRAALILAAGTVLTFPASRVWAGTDHASNDRVALVIGNEKYLYAKELTNPVGDAKAIAQKLQELHFDIVAGYDVDDKTLRADLREFREKAKYAKVALVYYAGHGVAHDEENYLLPVDIDPKQPEDLDLQALTLSSILKQLHNEERVNVVILDACRDNPFPKQLANGSRGFAERGLKPASQSQSRGALIVYATDAGATAEDGRPGEHSPFAQALLDHIEDPDVSIGDVMDRVRVEVFNKTDHSQTPWSLSGLLGEPVRLNTSHPRPDASPVAAIPVETVVPAAILPAPQATTIVPVAAAPAAQVAPPTVPTTTSTAATAGAGTYVTASVEKSPKPEAPGKAALENGSLLTEKNLNLTPATVKKIQMHLQVIRLFHGAVNGDINDASTRNAIIEWQKRQRLAPTRLLSQGQLDALLAITPTAPNPADLQNEMGTSDTEGALSLSSDDRRDIQGRLLAMGYFKTMPSGKVDPGMGFDQATRTAIGVFQTDVRATPTGYLGELQLQSLYERSENRYENPVDSGTPSAALPTRVVTSPAPHNSGYNRSYPQRQPHYNNNRMPNLPALFGHAILGL